MLLDEETGFVPTPEPADHYDSPSCSVTQTSYGSSMNPTDIAGSPTAASHHTTAGIPQSGLCERTPHNGPWRHRS